MEKQKIKKIIIAVSVLCIAAGAIAAGITGNAIFKESDAVHIEADKIEESTLLIGTHLIYLGALDDRIYEIAIQSARESGQSNIYYKSELAGGAWYEISSAYSIADITAKEKTVTDQEIENLWLTHHTKSDGITYDLRSKEAVNTYDIYPIYDLEAMKELEPVKNQYDYYKEEKKSPLLERNKKLIRKMFQTEVKDEETEEYDLKLAALSSYLKILRDNNGSSDEIKAVEKIIDKTDDGRRVLVYRKVAAGLETLSDQAASSQGISSDDFQLDAELMDAIRESQKNIEDAQMEKEDNMLKEGTMVMTKEEYSLAGRLTTNALEENYSGCDEETSKLIALYHIMDGEIMDTAAEIKLLEEDLISMAEHTYTEQLSAGVNEAYNQAVEKKSSHVVLEGIQEEMDQQYTMVRSELQFYIEARVERTGTKEAQEFITKKLKSVGIFGNKIPKDAFQGIAEQSVETYKEWLQKLLADLAADQGNQELNQLYEEKAKLEAERLDALDREELTEAKQIEALVEAAEQEIQVKEDAVSSEVKKLEERKQNLEQEAAQKQEQGQEISGLNAGITALENEIGTLLAGLPESSAISSIQEQKGNMMKLLEKKSLSEEEKAEMTAGIEGLGTRIDINGSMAKDALKELYQSMASAKFLEDTKEFDTCMEQIEEIIASHANVLDQVLDTKEITQILEEELGYQMRVSGNVKDDSEDISGDTEDETGSEGTGDENGGTGGSGTGGSGTGSGTGTGGSSSGEGSGAGTGGSGTGTGTGSGTGTGGSSSGEGSGAGTGESSSGESGTGTEGSGGGENGTASENSQGKKGSLSGGAASNSKQAVAALALAQYGEQAKDSQLDDMLAGMAAAASRQESSYFFPIVNKSSGTNYASVKAVAAYKGYRYVWNDNKKKAMLVSGGIYYGFSAFRQEVEREKEQKDTMAMEAAFQSTVFLPEEYLEQEFGCQVYLLSNTGYGVLVDEAMLKEAAEVSDVLVSSSKRAAR